MVEEERRKQRKGRETTPGMIKNGKHVDSGHLGKLHTRAGQDGEDLFSLDSSRPCKGSISRSRFNMLTPTAAALQSTATARFKGSSCTHSSILSLLRLHQYNTCTSTTSPMYCVRRCVVFYRRWFLHSNPNSSSASSPPPCACHPDAYPSKTRSVPQSETHGVHSHGPVSAGQFNCSSSLL